MSSRLRLNAPTVIPCSTIFSSAECLFWSLFGAFDISDLEKPSELDNSPGDKSTTNAHISILKTVFGFYNVVAVIILLNMLIGMMAKSYDGVEEKAQQSWAFHRTKTWLMYVKGEVMTPPPMNLQKIEKILENTIHNFIETSLLF